MKNTFFLTIITLLILTACAPAPATIQPSNLPPANPAPLTIMTHDSFAISEEIIRAFEQANNAKITIIKSGDTGSALNKAILTKDAPLADLFYGVDNTFLSRALEADIFVPYNSPALAQIPAGLRLDPQNRALPVDYGDVCLNYDVAWFAQNNLPVPQSLDDLTKPEYKGLLVVQNPATSSPGLAFLLATIAKYGEEGSLNYWAALKANGVVIVDGWETAYYTNFSASSGKGPQPLVVSYASSPAAEVFFAADPPAQAPTASILDGCFRQIEFVGLLKNAQNPELAQKFIDYMLSPEFQADLPLNMFVYPANPAAQLPEVFLQHAQTATNPASLPFDQIAANREAWIQAWANLMLK